MTDAHSSAPGLFPGTPVSTADGRLPAEWLVPGDRIVTRRGTVPLVAIHASPYSGPALRLVDPGLDGPLLLHPAQWLHLPGLGAGRAVDLADDTRLMHRLHAPRRLIRLVFPRCEQILSGRLALACPGRVPMAA